MRPYWERLRQAREDLRGECAKCDRTIPMLRDVSRCPHRETCAVPRCLNRLDQAVLGVTHPDMLSMDEREILEARVRPMGIAGPAEPDAE